MQLSVSPDTSSSSHSTRALGYMFVSPDEKQLFQARLDGFTFNRMAPYTGWEAFVGEARRLWEEYRRVTRPRGYKRIAVRYINQIDFPHTRIDLDD